MSSCRNIYFGSNEGLGIQIYFDDGDVYLSCTYCQESENLTIPKINEIITALNKTKEEIIAWKRNAR